jgi:hypothetical protein
MKRLLYFSLLITLLFACRKDGMETMNTAGVNSMAGRWKLAEVERASINNNNFWEPVTAAQADTLVFRADGVMLNPDGTPRCCAPKSLIINGSLMDIKPQTAIPANPACALVNCVYCPTWELTWTGDVLIISSCMSARAKYVR